VMYAGHMVEIAPDVLFAQPRHPYTRGLIASRSRPGAADQPRQALHGLPLRRAAGGMSVRPALRPRRDVLRQQSPAPDLIAPAIPSRTALADHRQPRRGCSERRSAGGGRRCRKGCRCSTWRTSARLSTGAAWLPSRPLSREWSPAARHRTWGDPGSSVNRQRQVDSRARHQRIDCAAVGHHVQGRGAAAEGSRAIHRVAPRDPICPSRIPTLRSIPG
jgi:hypothetical protein